MRIFLRGRSILVNSFVWTLSIVLMVCGGISLAASLASRSYAEKRQKYRGKAVATVVEIVVDEPDRKGKKKESMIIIMRSLPIMRREGCIRSFMKRVEIPVPLR